MVIVIDMQTGEVERRSSRPGEDRKAGPTLQPMPALQLVEHEFEQHRNDALPRSLIDVDVETFLHSMRRR